MTSELAASAVSSAVCRCVCDQRNRVVSTFRRHAITIDVIQFSSSQRHRLRHHTTSFFIFIFTCCGCDNNRRRSARLGFCLYGMGQKRCQRKYTYS